MIFYQQWEIHGQIGISSKMSLSRQGKATGFSWANCGYFKSVLLEGVMPSKDKAFSLQIVTGCIAVKKNLKARGIYVVVDVESINHVCCECPPACQVWVLSKIPSNPDIFPTRSLFANMDHLF